MHAHKFSDWVSPQNRVFLRAEGAFRMDSLDSQAPAESPQLLALFQLTCPIEPGACFGSQA